MARMKSKNVRRIESIEKVDTKKAVDTQKNAKPNLNSNSKAKDGTSFESGEGNIPTSGKTYQRRKKIPKIQNVEKTVLQSIIGQDKQVRQIIT